MVVTIAVIALVLYGIVVLIVASSFPGQARPGDRPGFAHVHVSDASIRYRDPARGSGRIPIVFLHGFAGTSRVWDGVVERTDCARPVVLDLPGFGGSSRGRISYALEAQRRRIVEFLDSLEIARAVLVGASMGGSVAVRVAADAPERVAGLVLMAPSGYPGSLRYGGIRGFLQGNPVGRALSRMAVSTPGYDGAFPNSLSRQAVSVVGSYDESFVAGLSRITAPTLLLWSRGDAAVPYRFAQRYLRHLRDVRLLTLPREAGHGIPTYRPRVRAEQICAFVSSLQQG